MTVAAFEDLTSAQRGRAALAAAGSPVHRLWLAPHRAMESPDPWQAAALRAMVTLDRNVMLLASRGAGKSQVTSCACYLEACLGGFAVVFSRSDRQAKEEVFDKVLQYHRQLALVPQERAPTMHDLKLANGGRVLSLPCSEDTVVGKHRVSLLIIDEAAKVPDSFYARVTPMMATTARLTGIEPRLVLLSTPFGKRGFYWREWTGQGRPGWTRLGPTTWQQVPRITAKYVASERAAHGDWWVEQEYESHLASTLAASLGGPKQVGSLVEGDELWQRGGRVCKVRAVRSVGPKMIVRATTECGTTLEASECHKVETGYGKAELRHAKSLRYCWYPKYSAEPLERLARVVGYNLGDGTVNGHSAYFFSKYKSDMDRLREDLLALGLSKRATVRAKKGKYACYAVSTSGTRMVRYGAFEGKKVEGAFDVPAWVRNGSEGVKREFLAALFGAKGIAPSFSEGGGTCLAPHMSMVKTCVDNGISFFNSLASMLEELGVACNVTINRRDGRYCFVLWVLGGQAGYKHFFERIGFRYAEVKERRAFEYALFLGARLRGAYHGFGSSEAWFADRRSVDGLSVKVTKVEDVGACDTVNLEVDSEDHSYLLADGLDNYNCQFLDTAGSFFNVDEVLGNRDDNIEVEY